MMRLAWAGLGAWTALVLLLLLLPGTLLAQSQAKPSAYRAAQLAQGVGSVGPIDTAAERYQIDSRAGFDRLARIHDPGTPEAQPHVLWLIDRAAANRVHFINTRRYPLHADYLRARYRLGPEHLGARLYEGAQRRFLLGTLSWHPQARAWVTESWQGDALTPALLNLQLQQLRAAFLLGPVGFKANASAHEAVAREAGVPFVTPAQLLRERPYVAYHAGQASGRLKLVDDVEAATLEPHDIVVLREVPLALPPVAGIVLAEPSTALSHVNLLAKGWGVPNIYLRDAATQLQALDGQWVRLVATRSHPTFTPLPGPVPSKPQRQAKLLQAPDVQHAALMPLGQMRAQHSRQFGGKAARLGALEALRRQGRLPADLRLAPVPDGFCVPFAAHRAFMGQAAAQDLVRTALATPGFESQPNTRKAALQRLRADLLALPVPGDGAQRWEAQWHSQLATEGVFVRSSSNSEDLAHFSGAGLYTTVPNVRADLAQAVKTVWASVWNAEAFEARRVAGLRHPDVAMAVFVQRAVDSRVSGVMLTRDPFDPTRRGVVYVSAKRGIGIKVVEGKRLAEQALYEARSRSIERLSNSGESTELRLDAAGGLVEQTLAQADTQVLTDAQVQRLARLAVAVKAAFGGVDQDIEWAIDGADRIVLLQARPYVVHHP